MYSKIQQMKEAGFSQRAAARTLRVRRNTVKRYWNMPAEEYRRERERVSRSSAPDRRREQIVRRLREYPDLTAAQIYDWLKEHCRENYKERTVSRRALRLREAYAFEKEERGRDYEAAAELPPGQQAQVDFVEKVFQTTRGGSKKVYAAAFVLSRSRYRYAETQSRPFTSEDLANIACRWFAYFGGMPRELVFDRDGVVCASENAGDIVYACAFEKFRRACGLQIRLCRTADPESKGKVENTVKHIKGKFLNRRLYADDETLSHALLDWLERTANARTHGATKRVPKEVFAPEREHLRPVPTAQDKPPEAEKRKARKDNAIVCGSNRSGGPPGTYYDRPEATVREEEGELRIFTEGMEPLCRHPLSGGRGLLLRNPNRLRDRSAGVGKLQTELETAPEHRADEFFRSVREEKPRYAGDQFLVLRTLPERYGLEKLLNAVAFCRKPRLFTSNAVRDYLEYHEKQSAPPVRLPPSAAVCHVATQKRPLEDYAKAGAET